MMELERDLNIASLIDEMRPIVQGSPSYITILNGRCSFDLSSLPNGVRVWDSANLNSQHFKSLAANFELDSSIKDNRNDCLFIEFEDSLKLSTPLYIYFLDRGKEEEARTFYNFYLLKKGVEISIVEKKIAGKNIIENKVSNSVSRWMIEKDVKLTHYSFLDSNKNDACEANRKTIVKQLKNSDCSFFTFHWGGGLTNNSVEILLDGEFASCYLYSMSLLTNIAIVNHDISVKHNFPECKSTQIFKGIFDDSSCGGFNSTVFVKKDAQKTLSVQKNNNILLSDYSSVKSNPQLEIFADDVECAHGSTIGQIDSKALFYLQSRGLSKKTATSMLLQGFLMDVVEKINEPEVEKIVLFNLGKCLDLSTNFKIIDE